jgi:hypothetical protein
MTIVGVEEVTVIRAERSDGSQLAGKSKDLGRNTQCRGIFIVLKTINCC